MAAQTDVQFFSHLNTLAPQLTNDWGCMINLLDACLVNGVTLPVVTSASVEKDTGNITVNFNTPHTCLLFQCVTLSGFTPNAMNGKYRIIGVPSTTQLTLSSDLSSQSATAMGTAKLSPLGYEIIFSAPQKRVYRALNPTAQHPFIRVDESLSSADGTTGVYTSTYAKYAMVGLIENMSHIDDYLDTSKLQLPLDTTDFAKNWKISGTDTNVVRGLAKWYWARYASAFSFTADSNAPNNNGTRRFTLCGNANAFYLLNEMTEYDGYKVLSGCGLFESALPKDLIPNWFLMSIVDTQTNTSYDFSSQNVGGMPITGALNKNKFIVPRYSLASPIQENDIAYSITPDYSSGKSGLYSANNISALSIPFYDSAKYLRGSLQHVYYAGSVISKTVTSPILADTSMYISDSLVSVDGISGCYFHLGEIV